MAFIAAADFREKTRKAWTQGILLDESWTDEYLDDVIALIAVQVESDLGDDFEPPTPDDDETLEVDGSGAPRLYIPRRVRSLTSVKTRDSEGVLTVEDSTKYRLRSSLSAAGTAMALDTNGRGAKSDWLDILEPLSTGSVWPKGTQTVQLTGKFGWAAVPDDIKRLTALYVYDFVKPKDHPLTNIESRSTVEGTIVYGPSVEIQSLVGRYERKRRAYVA